MAKKIDNKTGLTEISTIRDILMGQQMDDYEHRFQELTNQINNSEKRIMQKMEKMQEEFANRLSNLEDSMKRNLSELDTKMDRSTNQERIRLGQLFADLSNQLLNGN